MNEYGGNIQVESEYGKGTKFSFNMIVKSFTPKIDFEAQSEQLTGRHNNYPLISNTLRVTHKNIIESTEREQTYVSLFTNKKQTRSLTPKKSGEVPILDVHP